MPGPDWGAIFDWDGVIIDSSRAHEESWDRLAREEGRPLPPGHFQRSFGMRNEQIIPELLAWTREPQEIRRLSLRKEELYRLIIQKRGLTPLPGAAQLLAELQAHSIPRAIGSSTHRLNITTALDALGLRNVFQHIVCSEDVAQGKPNPEIFLTAARRLGLPPQRCVVFEDALVGLQAARAAGMKAVAVAGTYPAASLQPADRVVHSLADVTVADLTRWFV